MICNFFSSSSRHFASILNRFFSRLFNFSHLKWLDYKYYYFIIVQIKILLITYTSVDENQLNKSCVTVPKTFCVNATHFFLSFILFLFDLMKLNQQINFQYCFDNKSFEIINSAIVLNNVCFYINKSLCFTIYLMDITARNVSTTMEKPCDFWIFAFVYSFWKIKKKYGLGNCLPNPLNRSVFKEYNRI